MTTSAQLPNDPLWPRAAGWLAQPDSADGSCDLAFLGVPAYKTSITPTGAAATPAAVRDALLRYSTYAASHGLDVAELVARDLGDVADPDGDDGEARVAAAAAAARCELLIACGGDNSLTYSVMSGLAGGELAGWGLVTVDAHHDLRDGVTNGSPVRRLVADGLPGRNVVQIGIADFANSAAYSRRAAELGITVVTRDELRRRPLELVVAQALAIAGADGRRVFVDLDVDVCDRALVPGCPSAAPGGITGDELRQLAYAFALDPRVRAIDLAEIDATIDAPDGRTVRLAALLVLEAAAGLLGRRRGVGL